MHVCVLVDDGVCCAGVYDTIRRFVCGQREIEREINIDSVCLEEADFRDHPEVSDADADARCYVWNITFRCGNV